MANCHWHEHHLLVISHCPLTMAQADAAHGSDELNMFVHVYSLWSKTIAMLWGFGHNFQVNTQFTPTQACLIGNSLMNTFAYTVDVQFYNLGIFYLK